MRTLSPCLLFLCTAAVCAEVLANGPVDSANTPATIDKRIYHAYRSFWPELETTARFKELGVNTRCFFAANTINSLGFEYCKYPPIWKGANKYDFAAYDQQVNDLLSANPEAEFLCMIDLNTPPWLTRRLAMDSFSEISHAAANKQWLDITTKWMLAFIEHSEKTFGDRIAAYILSGGGTSEWYEYDRGRSSTTKNSAWRAWCEQRGLSLGEDCPTESALRKAAHENVIYDPQTEKAKIEYWRFHNGVIADALLHYAKVARAHVDKDKEIGAFFGYYLVSDNKLTSFGHLDYERVFASPDIDFFISPGNYNDRMIGGGSGPQLVYGTALRYGKRYLHEIDHRTHCVAKSWKTREDDRAGLIREAAFALVRHASLWWFDMWGGWYQEQETQKLIGRLKAVSDKYVDDTSQSVAQALLIADPQSAVYVRDKAPHASAMARQFRDKLNRTGAPFDVYSFNDLAAIDLSRYKVVFLPATLLITPERAEILRKHVLCDDRTVVWVYAPGICDGNSLDTARVKEWTGTEYKTPGPVSVARDGWTSVYSFEYGTLTPAALQKIMKDAGVHLYVDAETPVYANERLLAIHVKEGGPTKVRLPRAFSRVVEVVSGTVVAEDAAEFTYPFATPDTALFELVP